MKVLAVSDTVDNRVYNPSIRTLYGDVDVVFGCGDLPYYYLEYICDALDKPVFYVRGNHSQVVEYGERGSLTHPRGAVNLHNRVLYHNGLLLAGIEGSIRYRAGLYQYTQAEMWLNVFGLIPGFYTNKLKTGRYLDVLVTHAPPWGIHDQTDLPHQGVKAFLWLLRVFKPEYHFHGHIHLYRSDTVVKTWFGNTWVINAFGSKAYELNLIHYRGNNAGSYQ